MQHVAGQMVVCAEPALVRVSSDCGEGADSVRERSPSCAFTDGRSCCRLYGPSGTGRSTGRKTA